MFTHGNQLIVTGLPMKISLLSLVNSWIFADCRIFTNGNQLIVTGSLMEIS